LLANRLVLAASQWHLMAPVLLFQPQRCVQHSAPPEFKLAPV
jgi:hypothetical protein